jgi:hypothetical protein
MLDSKALDKKEKAQMNAWDGLSKNFGYVAPADTPKLYEDTAQYKPQTESFAQKHYLKDYFSELPGQGVNLLGNPWLMMARSH